MKLHLPLLLRSALMAVLASFSVAYGDNLNITVDGTSEELPQDVYDDANISIINNGYLLATYCVLRDNTYIDINNGTFAIESSTIGSINRVDTDPAQVELRINGSFLMNDSKISFANAVGSIGATITLDQGVFEMESSNIAQSTPGGKAEATIHMRSASIFHMRDSEIASGIGTAEATININDGSSFNMWSGGIAVGDGTAKATIHINNGGSFSMWSGNIGAGFGTTEATINISEGGWFSMQSGSIAMVEASETAEATININEAGLFDMRNGKIAYADGLSSSAKANINIRGVNAAFTTNVDCEGYISYARRGESDVHIDVRSDGRWKSEMDTYISYAVFNGNADASITVGEGGQFEMLGGHIAYATGADSKAHAQIHVEKGGELLFNGVDGNGVDGVYAAYAENTGNADVDIVISGEAKWTMRGFIASAQENGTAGADITIEKGGEYEIEGGEISRAYNHGSASANVNVKGGSLSSTLYGVIISFASSYGTAEATINVTDGGVFNMESSDSTIAYSYTNGTSSAEINVTGAEFKMQNGVIADTYGNGIAEASINVGQGGQFNMSEGVIAKGSGVAYITIKEGGVFTMTGGAIAKSTLSGSGSSLGSPDESVTGNPFPEYARAFITVEKGGTFTMSDGRIAYAESDGLASANIDVQGGNFEMAGGSIAVGEGSVNISVSDGGSFTMKNKAKMAKAGKAEEYVGAEISVMTGGVFHMGDGGIAEAFEESKTAVTVNVWQGEFHMDEGYMAYAYSQSEASAYIYVFDGGTFNMDGRTIALADASEAHAYINIYEGGTFNMDGFIAWGWADTDATAIGEIWVGGTFDMSSSGVIGGGVGSTVTITVGGEKGLFNYNGGTFGNDVTFTTTEHGVFNMSGVAFSRDITMEGGSLAGAAKYSGKALVNADDFFTGVMDFGGADAKFITVQKAGRGVNFSGLMSGSTLKLDNKLSFRVGAEHVTLGVDASATRSMIEFNGNSGTVDLNGATITLEFDAEALFANADGDNSQLEIRFTNGTIVGGVSNFEFGGGWDIWIDEDHVQSIVNGTLVVRVDLLGVWRATEHVGESGTVNDANASLSDFKKVVVDRDTNLMLSGDVTLNNLEGTHQLTVDGSGDTILYNEKANTVYNGGMTIKSGSLIKDGDGSFTMAGDLSANKVQVQEGDFIIAPGSSSVMGELEGKVQVAGQLELRRSSALGEISNRGGNVILTGAEQGSLQLKSMVMDSGSLHLNAGGESEAAQGGANVLLTGNMIFRNGTTTTLMLNLDSREIWESSKALMLTSTGHIFIERGASFSLGSLQMVPMQRADLENIEVMNGLAIHIVDQFTDEMLDLSTLADAPDGTKIDVKLGGAFSRYYSDASLTLQDNTLLLNATYSPENGDTWYEDNLTEAGIDSENAHAGAGLLSQLETASDNTLKQIDDTLVDMIQKGEKARAAEILSALAGSTTTALGAAQRDAMREHLARTRDHAVQQYAMSTTSESHLWIEGSISSSVVDSDGDASGYDLSSWGGSVGAEWAVNRELSIGISITAMYGDLTAEASDTAEGTLDSYYFSLWTYSKVGRDGHTLLVSFAMNDATLQRTVDYGTGSYTTDGTTTGVGFGAMYEYSYDMVSDVDNVLQLLLSASVLSTSMQGYEEEGAGGAGLSVGDQQQTVVTLAAGLRWRASFYELFGRTANIELRGAIAQDLGDTCCEVENALLVNPNHTRMVKGTEVGSTSLQLGAGLNLPMDASSSLYFNANADLRSGSASWNMNVGLRYSF